MKKWSAFRDNDKGGTNAADPSFAEDQMSPFEIGSLVADLVKESEPPFKVELTFPCVMILK